MSSIFLIYFVFASLNILINFDHGILPAAALQIKHDLFIDDMGLGLLGSMVYAGLLMGSVVSALVFDRYATKQIIVSTLLCYILSLSFILLSRNMFILAASRLAVGLFQVIIVIYLPVWVDLYCGDSKTMKLTFLQIGVPLGVVAGYGATALIVYFFKKWQYAFALQIALLIPLLGLTIFFDNALLETRVPTEEEASLQQKLHPVQQKNKTKPSQVPRTRVSLPARHPHSSSAVRPVLSLPGINDATAGTLRSKLEALWENKLFLLSMLSLSAIFFVVTGIQFWLTDYMQNVLHAQRRQVFAVFTITSITAPTLGVLVGGTLLQKMGGYTDPRALDVCLVEGGIASACALPIPFLDSFEAVVVLLWLLLFFGGCLLPTMFGVMLNALPKNQRAFGNSTAHLIQNITGYFPAPLLYGAANSLFAGTTQRAGITLLMFWSLWGLIGMYFARRWLYQNMADHKVQMQQPKSLFDLEMENMPRDNSQQEENSRKKFSKSVEPKFYSVCEFKRSSTPEEQAIIHRNSQLHMLNSIGSAFGKTNQNYLDQIDEEDVAKNHNQQLQ